MSLAQFRFFVPPKKKYNKDLPNIYFILSLTTFGRTKKSEKKEKCLITWAGDEKFQQGHAYLTRPARGLTQDLTRQLTNN